MIEGVFEGVVLLSPDGIVSRRGTSERVCVMRGCVRGWVRGYVIESVFEVGHVIC